MNITLLDLKSLIIRHFGLRPCATVHRPFFIETILSGMITARILIYKLKQNGQEKNVSSDTYPELADQFSSRARAHLKFGSIYESMMYPLLLPPSLWVTQQNRLLTQFQPKKMYVPDFAVGTSLYLECNK
jgi:hypothetical protein